MTIDVAIARPRNGPADTGEVMDDKEKKDFNNETMKEEFLAVETMKTISRGLVM